MEILKWVMLSMFTVALGAIVGFGLYTRKVFVAWYHLAALIVLLFMVSLASSFIGHLAKEYFSYRFFEVFVSLILIAIGVAIVVKKPIYPGQQDLLLFGLTITLDVGLLGFHYGQNEDGGFGLAMTISLLLLGSIICGMAFGNRRLTNWRLKLIYPHIPGLLIVCYGLIKML
ncbi:hypothetical protein [Caldalkalibacillus salinus]|uniref:hypothetical protein n=1 Tax=Caldalkalibacillus salinus TaxID=2803787 RepID=UPI0019232C43|nr:hypothetical protein [Caldalkalibacillus salinus]